MIDTQKRVLNKLSTQDILDYLTYDRGVDGLPFAVNDDGPRRPPPQNLQEQLCEMFDLPSISTKDEIIEYIKSAI